MPTQRLEEKRVEEHVGEGERKSACMWERKREKEHKHMGEKEREKALWLLLLYVFPSPWACPLQIGLARSAVGST